MIPAVNFKDVLITLGFQEENKPGIFRKTCEDLLLQILMNRN